MRSVGWFNFQTRFKLYTTTSPAGKLWNEINVNTAIWVSVIAVAKEPIAVFRKDIEKRSFQFWKTFYDFYSSIENSLCLHCFTSKRFVFCKSFCKCVVNFLVKRTVSNGFIKFKFQYVSFYLCNVIMNRILKIPAVWKAMCLPVH